MRKLNNRLPGSQTARNIACSLLLWGGCTSQATTPPAGESISTPAATSGNTASGAAGTTPASTGATVPPAAPASSTQAAGSTPSAGAQAPSAAGAGNSTAGTNGSGSSAGMPAATSGTSGAAGAAGMGMPAAGGGAGAGAPTFKQGCKSGDPGPCASFIPSNGKELALGPYGAVMERNVGKGFEYAVASGDSDNNGYCKSFTASFGEDEKSTQELLDVADLDMTLFTVYRPAQFPEAKVPIITWGNGTCAKPEGYGTLLRYVASHGFFVVAANSRFVGSGTPMTKGIDFALAANADQNSPYYQKLDPMKVGAMGHSQGGQGTLAVVKDSRVQAVIIWNAAKSASKPFLAVSGDMDVVGLTASSMRSAVSSAQTKAAFLYYHMVPMTGSASGHLTLMTQPERVVEPAVAFWKFVLNGDAESQKYFAGTSCKLCNRADEFDFGQHGMD